MNPNIIPISIGAVLVLTTILTGSFFAFIKPRFKFFNRCFLCHKKNYVGYSFEKLKQAEQPGYNTTYYYHNILLPQQMSTKSIRVS
jgi:hypothetical protein